MSFTSPEDEYFFGAIGRFVISWAHVELGLDLSVTVIHERLNGSAIQREAPWSLQRKLDYLRNSAKKISQLAKHRERMIEVAARIEEMSEARNDIIHGCVVEHGEGTGEAMMARLRRGKGAKPKTFKATTTEILQCALLADKLGTLSLTLGDELRAEFVPP